MQCFGSKFNESGSRLFVESGSRFRFSKTKNCKKILLKDVQATEEASSPSKRTSSTAKHKFFHFFLLFLWVFYACLDPDTDSDPGTAFKDFNERHKQKKFCFGLEEKFLIRRAQGRFHTTPPCYT
jgi:hypothetical protein